MRKSTNRHILEIPERHNILWVFAIIYDWTNFLVYICCKKFENCFSGSIESYAIVGNAHLKIGCQSMNSKVWMQKLPKYITIKLWHVHFNFRLRVNQIKLLWSNKSFTKTTFYLKLPEADCHQTVNKVCLIH